MPLLMSEAVLVETGKKILASKVWTLGRSANNRAWKCSECPVAVVPVAWRPASWRKQNEPHKVPAHFKRKMESENHEPGCPIGQLAEREEPGGSDRERHVRRSFKEIALVVSFDNDTDCRPGGVLKPRPDGGGSQCSGPSVADSGKTRRRLISSIEEACRIHYDYKEDKAALSNMQLQVEGLTGQTFMDTFRGIRNAPSPKLAKTEHILFQGVRYNKGLRWNGQSLILNLNAGCPSPAQRCFRVSIHTGTWRREERELFGWFEKVYNVFAANYKAGERETAILYFIGEQDTRDHMLFHVHDPRKLALIYPLAEQNTPDDIEDAEEQMTESALPESQPKCSMELSPPQIQPLRKGISKDAPDSEVEYSTGPSHESHETARTSLSDREHQRMSVRHQQGRTEQVDSRPGDRNTSPPSLLKRHLHKVIHFIKSMI